MEIITVANKKGGSGKTTTAVHLAHAFSRMGRSVFLIDTDPQRSAERWSILAESWDVPVVGSLRVDLHEKVRGIVPGNVDTVIVDTPPTDQATGIVTSAMRAADKVIITMAPTMMEFDHLSAVDELIRNVYPLWEEPAKVGILLNRTIANSRSLREASDLIVDGGYHLLDTHVPRWESIAQSFGQTVTDGPAIGVYEEVAREVADLEAVAHV